MLAAVLASVAKTGHNSRKRQTVSTRAHSGNSNSLSKLFWQKVDIMSESQYSLFLRQSVLCSDAWRDGSLVSAQAVLPIIFNLIHPKSIVDVGCGAGTWLSVAKSLGAKDAVGFEGEWVRGSAKDDLDIRFVDLEQSLRLNRRFDRGDLSGSSRAFECSEGLPLLLMIFAPYQIAFCLALRYQDKEEQTILTNDGRVIGQRYLLNGAFPFATLFGRVFGIAEPWNGGINRTPSCTWQKRG